MLRLLKPRAVTWQLAPLAMCRTQLPLQGLRRFLQVTVAATAAGSMLKRTTAEPRPPRFRVGLPLLAVSGGASSSSSLAGFCIGLDTVPLGFVTVGFSGRVLTATVGPALVPPS